MAAGKPVIASGVGGVPHLVRDGVNGFLVPYGDPRLLARRMVDLLRDANLRARMGRASREDAERRFSIDGAARSSLAIYREILSGR
jgi:glycosyltransferase involved in cell wall biosynthesis